MPKSGLRHSRTAGADTAARSAISTGREHYSGSAAHTTLPAGRLMQLQRTIGNRGVGQMLGLAPASRAPGGTLVQRELKDTTKVVWNNDKLSGLWGKMVNRSEGKDGMPGYTSTFIPEGEAAATTPRNVLLELGNGQSYTERELAEIIIDHRQIKPLFLNPRLRQAGDEIALGGSAGDAAIKKVIQACLFYHATFDKHVNDIMSGGLKASKGGAGEGVSEHGRDEVDAKATYNKWSKGHVFVTKVLSEAQGYRDKMNEKEAAKIIHVFSTPFFTKAEGKVDIDSKAGIKMVGDMKAIGDGSALNKNAENLIGHALKELDVAVADGDIQRVYAAEFGG
ncbi:hypothetical protein FE784_35585 [Paenibacillus hemerocallicola]|uniref:Uncharacterized protein n=1 Tax=Paenibacillus hemerocallicola TaxID=1172614 RepID=A0A5C4SXE4_9BACL|nr:hypothetical protein [Paenibacillus hemerocallicola]TNJ60667.1 hypothetical protein FE784_35585 [Paenibacillus hemerocallicola]